MSTFSESLAASKAMRGNIVKAIVKAVSSNVNNVLQNVAWQSGHSEGLVAITSQTHVLDKHITDTPCLQGLIKQILCRLLPLQTPLIQGLDHLTTLHAASWDKVPIKLMPCCF